MKLVIIVFLVLGLVSSSTMANAEGPVPFMAYEQAAGGSSSAPPMPGAKADSTVASNHTVASTQSPHPGQMTSGGKVMTGVGIAMVGIGAVLIGFGASVDKNAIAGSQIKSVGLGAGAGFAGIGTVMIIVGVHKRKAK